MEQLTPTERAALLIPLAGGLAFGLGPLLLPEPMAALTGYAGDDPFIARYAGAATLGYAIALALGIVEGRARPLRFVLLATLVFNAASILACAVEIVAGSAKPVVYVVFLASALITALTAFVLRGHAEPPAARDVGEWVVTALAILTVPAAVFGLFPLVAPNQFAALFRAHGTDTFLFRQAGAATLGYAAMGVAEIRSGRWNSIRLPVFMALVFNAISFVVSVLGIAGQIGAEGGLDTWLPYAVAPVALFATAACGFILLLRGR